MGILTIGLVIAGIICFTCMAVAKDTMVSYYCYGCGKRITNEDFGTYQCRQSPLKNWCSHCGWRGLEPRSGCPNCNTSFCD